MDDQPSNAPTDPPAASPESGDPRWDAVARELAGEGDATTARTVDTWRAEHPDDADAVAALDRTLDRLAFVAPSDLDVEGALRRVKERRAAEDASEAPRVLPLRTPVRPARRWTTF